VRGLLFGFFIITSGCFQHQNHQIVEKNWLEIYRQELIIAKDNNDIDAWIFFWPEYKKELNKNNDNN